MYAGKSYSATLSVLPVQPVTKPAPISLKNSVTVLIRLLTSVMDVRKPFQSDHPRAIISLQPNQPTGEGRKCWLFQCFQALPPLSSWFYARKKTRGQFSQYSCHTRLTFSLVESSKPLYSRGFPSFPGFSPLISCWMSLCVSYSVKLQPAVRFIR